MKKNTIKVYTLEQAKKVLIKRALRKIITTIFYGIDGIWSIFVWFSPVLTIAFFFAWWISVGY